MKIRRENGKPWIAKVVISAKEQGGEFIFGKWIGDWRNGEGEGELIHSDKGEYFYTSTTDKLEAEAIAEELRKQGYDVEIRVR